ncbi:hypothetical protein I4U23_008856 [Adineta vaga]|nr:hypothetical protein I4U23_008856 [Adineta vaga]
MDNNDKSHEFSTLRKTESNSSITFWKNLYRWRMRHYFYIHVFIFIFAGLLGGLGVFVIENYIESNPFMYVTYMDSWFIAASCICSCGLTTLDFARLSTQSQILLMILTICGGITVSTLPALMIKAQTHKHASGPQVDNDHLAFSIRQNSEKNTEYSLEAQMKIARLPHAEKLRYCAYVYCLLLIPITCLTIYLCAFLSIGSWIQKNYRLSQLRQDGRSINPWYASLIITITGFNQNGLAPWSDSLSRFVHDTMLNIIIIMLVMSGNVLFPFIFRNVIMFVRWLVPWHQKIIFDYILLNNHRLSTVLFPTVQTRIYLIVTFGLYMLSICVSIILDYRSQSFIEYTFGQCLLIFSFHTVSARFAGFETIDINLFTEGTLIIYLLLMAVKPQMLCALYKSPFDWEWQTIRDGLNNLTYNIEEEPLSTVSDDSSTNSNIFPIRRLHHLLKKRNLKARSHAENYFTSSPRRTSSKTKTTTLIKYRLLIIFMCRRMLSHSFTLLTRTRTWLFIFIFLICSFESYHMIPFDENITVIKIVFEVVSAFGTVGLTTGYPNLKSSLATVFSYPSKIVLLLTMLMGRHRGLLDSMKDQEKIEYSAHLLLERWKLMAKEEHPRNDDINLV